MHNYIWKKYIAACDEWDTGGHQSEVHEEHEYVGGINHQLLK